MRAAMIVVTTALALTFTATWAADPPRSWNFAGRVQAAAAVEVRPRVTGYLTRVAVKEGAEVKQGDLLVEIFPRPYQLDLDAAQARVKGAEAKLQAARLTTTNSKKLTQSKVISPDELALHQLTEAEAEAALAAAKVDAQRAELNLAGTQVKSPIDGRVSRIQLTEGNLVVADQTPIMTVMAVDPLNVTFNVDESTLLRLRRDHLAEPDKLDVEIGFSGEEGYPHSAKLDVIAPDVDPATGTVRFRATLQNPKGLLSPGMSARVRLAAPAK